MSLILAIEPDRQQASKVSALTQTLGVDLVIGESTEEALVALGSRVPDLVLTSQLLAPKDESALSERLRALDAAGNHAQTLVIPVLGGVGREPKKKGGLFGRLRRTAADDAGETEGCDPAVFSKEIMEYLERGAAERAALAAAQADLEAAWADTPAPHLPSVATDTTSGDSGYVPSSSIDVRPDMAINDPHALFGEFAAIPIRRPEVSSAPSQYNEPTISSAPGESDAFDDDLPPATPAWTPPPVVAGDEDWEEITLDPDAPSTHATEPSADMASMHAAAHHEVDVASEPMDLDAFVRELHTVESTANAEPMIPTVDLSHSPEDETLALLPEPVAVTELELHQEARAAFDAEIAAAFGAEPLAIVETSAMPEPSPYDGMEQAFRSEREISWTPALDHEPGLGVEPTPASVEAHAMSAAESHAENPIDVALAAFDPELEVAQHTRARTWEPPAESWRSELDLLPPPPAFTAPSAVEPTLREPVPGRALGDVLSAIQRDIDQRRAAEEAAPAIAKPTSHVAGPPLVFPSRSVAASVIAAIESGAADRARPEPVVARTPAPDVARPDRALAALLETVSMSDSLRAKPVLTVPPVVESPQAEPPTAPPTTTVAEQVPVVAEPIAAVSDTEPLSMAESVSPAEASIESVGSPGPDERSAIGRERVEEQAVETTLAAAPAPTVDPLAWLTAPAAVATPISESPHERAQVLDVPTPETAVGATTVAPFGKGRAPKSKKKRRHQTPEVPPRVAQTTVNDWGFFDAQTVGFGPLVARLNQSSTGTFVERRVER